MGKPPTIEEFINRHKADLQQAGFDEQFGCFVYFLLKIEGNDEIIYEREDDIVVNCANGCRWLIQVKHSVDKDSKMTDADTDFWKTIDNWLSLCSYCKTEEEQDIFLKDGNQFIIYTNKIIDNSFSKKIKELKSGTLDISDILIFLQSIERTVSYFPTIDNLLKLDNIILRRFLMKVECQNIGDSLCNIYQIFLYKFHNPTKADLIVNELLGKMLREKKQAANNKTTLKYIKGEFLASNKSILSKVGDESLSAIEYDDATITLPKEINKWAMVRQMEKIQVIGYDAIEEEKLITYYGFWCCYKNSKQYYYSVQLMTPELEAEIDKKATRCWKISHDKCHRRIRPDSDNNMKINAGSDCFYEMMEKEIGDGLQKLQMPFSSGWFLNLSNRSDSQIHWHYDWKHDE